MLTLLTKIRKQLLWIWVGFSIPVFILVFIQTIAGKYVEIETTPWLWLGVNLLPGFILLMVGAIRNKKAGKFVQTFIYRIILLSTIAYLLLVLTTLFSMTAGSAEQSLASYFQQSYKWLLPFQALLMIIFALLFFRKEAMFRPNEQMIKGYLSKEIERASTKNNLLQQQGYELLVASNYTDLFKTLREQLKEETVQTELLMLETQYNDWQKKTTLGLVDNKEAQLTINRITMALIQLIGTM